MSFVIVILVIFAIFVIAYGVIIYRLHKHYTALTANVSQKDLITSLNHLISISESNSDSLKSLSEKLESEIKENKKHLQKIGFNRYNPFTDTGGDQSFSLSLLDENGDGVVISSLHSRENTRLYAKKVEQGKVPNQALSKEETQVIKEALK